ncbi:hypothetical protein IW261DRAFT_1414080 [Armillaria novae-zelandiae]|uniref:Shikimate dehydrogenase substrate binding N-terminal domain-containing protein n=1 Tax=Armillaria novae-zelandiae TaxID=153914 RepID=A0AA39PRX5_9AGAR|nr:hypothetical protein IW261DRAFT_1414080 [Armillaria novae-zelandiae]
MAHPSITHPDAQKLRKLHLFGYPIVHSVGPDVHTFVAESVGLPWKCTHFETSYIEKIVEAMKAEDFIAGAVTMPLKLSITEKMDSIDDLARVMGAVNTITVTTDKKLVGSNTDAAGIRDALGEVSEMGKNLPGMVIGAGGASRAAIYALLGYLNCSAVYLVNRDPQKAEEVVAEMVADGFSDAKEKVKVIESVEQANILDAPFYVVGCIPNNTPATEGEKSARAVAANLFRTERPGVFLDMCFKPRVTQLVEIAESRGWVTIDGIEVLGLQLLEQWRLWLGPNVPLPSHAARQLMRDLAIGSATLNGSSSVGFNQAL